MTDHLPECPEVDPKWGSWCICDRLRACEQRVHDHYSNLAPVGFVLGVQAARDAVAALPYGSPLDDALAAIDALRGES